MQSPPHRSTTWPSGDDNTGFNLIVIALGCVAGGWLLWAWYHGPISAAVLVVFRHEIAFIRLFTHRYDFLDRHLRAADPNAVVLADLYRTGHAVGMFFRILAAALLLLLAAACTARAAPARYRRAFDLDGLIREQVKSFRTSAAFLALRLQLAPPAPGEPRPADYALTPEEWIARYATGHEPATAKAGEPAIVKVGVGFDEAAARRALVRQLGPRWRGIEQAIPTVRALFAVFALHLGERRGEALRLLGDLSSALGNRDRDEPEGPLALPAPAVAAADRVLCDYELAGSALSIANRHAYTHTALMALLNAARLRAGVLAPGQFAWLKLVDRPLWYALHSLGFENPGIGRYLHPNPRVEAVGACDHWAVERLAGEPVIEPSLDRTIDALRKVASTRCARGQ
jgi:intracellular multiplication protein IcmP